MRAVIRHAASAFTTGAAIALVLDVLLQFSTGAVRVSGGMLRPWWIRVAEHSVWLVLGLLLWMAAPLLAEWVEDIVPRATVSRRTVWELVGVGMLALPPGHLIGQWIVLALQLTASGTWPAEGRVLLSGAYYGTVLLSIAPWVGAGAIVRAWARHMVTED